MTGVSVEFIKKIQFTQLTLNEQFEIKCKGRCTPDIIIRQPGVSKNKRYIRSFNSDWYDKIKWLCGCEIRNALFCFPCLLLGGESRWTESGFTNISRIKEKCEKHQISKKHMENVVSLSLLGQVHIPEQVSEAFKAARLKHNAQVKKNREMLSKLIDCLKFCGEFELPIRGGQCEGDPENLGVFKGLINYVSTYDPSLINHLENSPAFHGSSKTIQNELLQSMLRVCRDQIVSEIREATCLAVMAEDTTDISEFAQFAVVFRYELNGSVYERFWGIFNPGSISNCLLNEINLALRNKTDKLVSQTYGRSVIYDEQGVLQNKIQKIFPNAYFIHGYHQKLYTILKHVSASLKSPRLFFANIIAMSTYIYKSPQALACLNKYLNGPIPKSRWGFNKKTINSIYENRENLAKCFDELQSLNTTDETVRSSATFSDLLRNETFLFWLEFYKRIIPITEALCYKMSSKYISTFRIQRVLNEYYKSISDIRNGKHCESGCACNITEMKEMCDRLCEEAEQRFAFTVHLIAAKLFYRENFEKYRLGLPIAEIEDICSRYVNLDQEKLENELQIFYSRDEFHDYKGLMDLLHILNDENLSGVFTETIKLIKILVTIPMSTNEQNRCFSTFKKVQSFLKNNCYSSNYNQLNAMSMILIEKNMILQIKNFNERVIEKFSKADDREIDFIFK